MKIPISPSTNLVMTLRDMGYTLETAIADVIDNSISASAGNIWIEVDTGAQLRIAIIDDGEGLTRASIQDVLTLAASSPLDRRSNTDLGRFGVGLKTASWSQCKRLTIASRNAGHVHGATIDLDEMQSRGDWTADGFDESTGLPDLPYLDRLGPSGTVILWEKLDRLDQTRSPNSPNEESRDESRQYTIDERGTVTSFRPNDATVTVNRVSDETVKFVQARMSEVGRHLELVFHRFMVAHRDRPAISIYINGRKLVPYDPFMRGNPRTQETAEERITIRGKGVVRIQGYTLPYKKYWTDTDTERVNAYGGASRTQGFYLYREDRLILWGKWFGLKNANALHDLARIRIDIPNTMDELWHINIMKGSAQPPRIVKDRLRRLLDTLIAPANRVYTRRGYQETDGARFPLWIRTENGDRIEYTITKDHPLLADLSADISEASYKKVLQLLAVVASSLPVNQLYADAGGRKFTVNRAPLDPKYLPDVVDLYLTGSIGKASLSDQIEFLSSVPLFEDQIDKVQTYLADRRSSREHNIA